MRSIRTVLLTRVSLIGLMGVALAQNASHPKPPHADFHWDSKQATELDYHHTIAKSTELPPSDKSALIKALVVQMRPSPDDGENMTESQLRKLVMQARLKLVDLNGDGVAEAVVQASGQLDCGATGNCAFWIFEKTPQGYRKILDTRDPEGIGGAQMYTVMASKTSGFSDLVLAAHESASEKALLVYRYKNGRYKQAACYDANWLSTDRGSFFQELKHPVITRCTP